MSTRRKFLQSVGAGIGAIVLPFRSAKKEGLESDPWWKSDPSLESDWTFYRRGRSHMMSGNFDWTLDPVRVELLNERYAPNESDIYSRIRHYEVPNYSPVYLTNKRVCDFDCMFRADNINFGYYTTIRAQYMLLVTSGVALCCCQLGLKSLESRDGPFRIEFNDGAMFSF